MKRIINISALLAAGIMLLAGCQKEEFSTDQYADDRVALNVYGPQPVMRGGILRFLGSNLDQVISIVIPGVDPVTDIEVVQAGVPSEIRITVPKDGPEPGLLTLVAADGTEITTKTELTYLEPIEFEGFSPASVHPGDVITIKGDYLNLIHEVIFSENVRVSEKDFESHSRYEIKVEVPVNARTGVIGLGDIDELNSEDPSVFANIINSEEELTVAQPEVTEMTADRWKAGETVTVKGRNFGYVASVLLQGTEVTEFETDAAGTELTFALPAGAADGEAYLVAFSGVEVLAGEYETVVPSGLAAEPSPVKASGTLTISGKDLDLVSSVTLPGQVTVSDYSISDGSVSFSVPDTAQEGDIILGMANGKTVTVAYTLVKPAVTGYSANPAAAGSEISVTGTDLDLVTSVTFGGGIEVAVSEPSETEFTVTVPTTAETGAVSLNLANGASVEGPELAIDKPVACYVTELPAEGEEIYGGTVLILPVANPDVLTGVHVNGSDVNYLLNAASLYVSLPETAGAGTVITLISSNGTVEYTIDCIPNNISNKVIWSGEWACGNWGGNQDLAWGGYDWNSVDLSAGTVTLVVELEQDASATYWQFMLKTGTSWNDLAGFSQIDMTAGQTVIEIPLSQEMLSDLQANNGLIITGANYTLRKLTLRTEASSETVIWEGSTTLTWNTGGRVCIPAAPFENCKAGAKINFYFTQTPDTWSQIQFNYANWTELVFPEIGSSTFKPTDDAAGWGWTFDSRCLTCTLTQEIIDSILASRTDIEDEGAVDCGIILQGDGGNTFTKVTIK